MKSSLYSVCVVGGAGHIGAPLGIVFAKNGIKTLLYDINQTALDALRSGRMPFMEENGPVFLKEALNSGNLGFTSASNDLANIPYIIITIGTPLDEFHNPKYSLLERCLDAILPSINSDTIIILRSTVSPGVTEYLDTYLKNLGIDNGIAFCPERVVQGYALDEITSIPQIISGTSQKAILGAKQLFSTICSEIIDMEPKEAELAKLVCNAYRYINFATTNELFMLAESAGVDYNAMLKKAKWNYPRLSYIPGPGFAAGPCLMKDTMQLFAFDKLSFRLGIIAQSVNESLPNFIVHQIKKNHSLKKLVVGVLGMAFKADNDDIRDSLSFKLKKLLQFQGATVLCSDEYVEDTSFYSKEYLIEKSDLLIIGVPHQAYLTKGLFEGKNIIDIWGLISESNDSTFTSDKKDFSCLSS